MRIIVAHNTYQQVGGEDTVFASEVDLLRKNGHEVFTYIRRNSELNETPVLRATIDTIWSMRSAKDIGQLIDSTKADLVHFHNTLTRISPSAYYIAKAKGAAVVQTLHNYRLLCPVAVFSREDKRPCEDCLGRTPPWPSVLHACWRDSRAQTAVLTSMLTLHRALGTWKNKVDHYIALTQFARQKFILGGLPAEKISVKPNFVEKNTKTTRTESYAIYVGRLAPEKGIEVMLGAWKKTTGFALKIAGNGPLKGMVRDVARHSPHIEWLGHLSRDQIQELMAKAYCLIFPSMLYEGMPMTILEAFASGLPVIAPRFGVMQEMVADGKSGLLYTAGNEIDLAAKVNWAFLHRQEMGKMREKCLSVYSEKWAPEKNYEMLMKVYGEALASTHRD
jgi:glycosyltransferase involved in cell wall biosynthesis